METLLIQQHDTTFYNSIASSAKWKCWIQTSIRVRIVHRESWQCIRATGCNKLKLQHGPSSRLGQPSPVSLVLTVLSNHFPHCTRQLRAADKKKPSTHHLKLNRKWNYPHHGGEVAAVNMAPSPPPSHFAQTRSTAADNKILNFYI